MTKTNRLLAGFTLWAVLGCGLMAGVFFTFSVFVMSALAQLPAPQGIAAMQAINITVINPVFMAVFMGTAAVCCGLAIFSLRSRNRSGAVLRLVGSSLYLVGTFGVTAAFNVPLNDALATVKPHSAAGAHLWSHYLVVWTAWNHVRTLSSLLATAAMTIAFAQRVSE